MRALAGEGRDAEGDCAGYWVCFENFGCGMGVGWVVGVAGRFDGTLCGLNVWEYQAFRQ